jgi:hypothetical protein
MNQFERLETLYFEYIRRPKRFDEDLSIFEFCQINQLIEINNSIRNIEAMLIDIKGMIK